MFSQITKSNRKEYMQVYHKKRWENTEKRVMDLVQHKKYYNLNKDKYKIYYLVNKERIRRKRVEWYQNRKLKNPLFCKVCGKLLDWKNISSKCFSCRMQGENNPRWQGGKSYEPYTPIFNRQLKERIRVRDNFICQLCGIPELECNERLSIHHIDYDKENCSIDNLTTLCRSCNTKINANRNYWISYFKEKRNVLFTKN